jgi:hypothetical protein
MFPSPESRYLPQVLKERELAAASNDFRTRVRYDLEGRPSYAFGLLAAADVARFCGVTHITAIEFGVAEGGGVRNLAELAERVTRETGVVIDIVGFDTGSGLPPPKDFRDHPEIWSAGDFSILDRVAFDESFPKSARMLWGDIAETISGFTAGLGAAAPVGFVSIDVDIYTSTISALELFLAESDKLLPVIVTYFDDTLGGAERIGSIFRNRWAGQLLAIDEFNGAHATRKIDVIRTLRYRRPLNQEQWLQQIYGVHILDHPFRNRLAARDGFSMEEHRTWPSMKWPL